MQDKQFCVCCGYDTLMGDPGQYDICPICFWEDDPFQRMNIDRADGANKISLRQAQKNFEAFGACDEESLKFVIKPGPEHSRSLNWKLTAD